MNDLINTIDPHFIEVWGNSIDPSCNHGRSGTKYKEWSEFRLKNHDLNPEKIDDR